MVVLRARLYESRNALWDHKLWLKCLFSYEIAFPELLPLVLVEKQYGIVHIVVLAVVLEGKFHFQKINQSQP